MILLKKTPLLCVFFALNICAQSVKVNTIYEILNQLTLEEKVSLCSGNFKGFRGIERLKIHPVECTDGGRGATCAIGATAFPSGVAQGATWNPTLIERAARIMGEEAKAVGKGILLAPACNILRDPLCGRFFEYYTEDPYLNGEIAAAFTIGVQSNGIAACAKHYACNNRENNRNFYMSIVDDRTLHEIYLSAFKAAIQKGHLWAVMTSANGLNNEYVSDSRKMLTDVLKNRWRFDGIVLTDWLQTRSTEKAAFAGLDISMPGGDDCGFGKALLNAVKVGRVSVETINQKAERILRLYSRINGIMDGDTISRKQAVFGGDGHHAVAREVAEESIVLLKNDDHMLPLNIKKLKNVLLTGPNADRRFCIALMGGSSWVESPYEVSVLQGVKKALADANVNIMYVPSDELGGFTSIPETALRPIEGVNGFRAQYFVNGNPKPVITRTEKKLEFMWEMKSPDPSITRKDFGQAYFDANIIPPVDGKYTFRLTSAGGIAYMHDNEWEGAPMAVANPESKTSTVTASVDLKKGEPFHVCIKYWHRYEGDAAIRLEWEVPESEESRRQWSKIDQFAKKADVVIFAGGLDHNLDTEGRDRGAYTFPENQEGLINHLAKVNKKICVVMINGSPVELGGWMGHAKSIVEAWYPGMEGGTAVANILFGKTNPSGRLPFSWAKKIEDVPCKKLAYEDNDNVLYTDSLMVGYRYYDTKGVSVQFPFGYGLSYTTFSYSDLRCKQMGEGKITVSVRVTNTGKFDGKEVVQIYVRPVNPSVFRPAHELKSFSKVNIKAGESKVVNFELDADAFSFYDVSLGDWQLDKCRYMIDAGRASNDIKQSTEISLE